MGMGRMTTRCSFQRPTSACSRWSRRYYTGYSVKTLPGVREAIEQKKYSDAEAEVGHLARAIDRETALLDSASGDLERLKQA